MNPAPSPTKQSPTNPTPDNHTFQEPYITVAAFLTCCGFEHLHYDGSYHIFADPQGTASSAKKGYYKRDTVEAEPFAREMRRLSHIEEEWVRKNRRRRSDSADANETDNYCFAHRHMTFEEFGLWVYVRGVSGKTGTFFFDGRSVGKQFDGQGKNTAYRVAKGLVDKGWFEVVKAAERDESGKYSATQYHALSHAEWVKKHPNHCPKPVPKSGQVPTNDLTGQELASPEIGT